MEPRIDLTDTLPSDAFEKIRDGLRGFNYAIAGEAGHRPLAVLLTDPQSEKIVGGLWGKTGWGYLYTDMLFIPEAMRRFRLGSILIAMAEAEAAKRGCHGAWVDTYDFQARGFYERLGYTVFGTLDGPPPVYPRYFLSKKL